jgi:hypothetical protein
MKRRGDTVRYTTEEIDEMLARGESRTDWAAIKAVTEDELEASIAADPDDVHEPIDWSLAVEGIPPKKRDVHMRIPEPDLQLPNAPYELARSRVWISGEEPRIEVGRLDDPYRDDTRASAVRRCERATDLELLTKRIARLARHRIIQRMVEQRAFELSPIPRRETEGREEFCLGCPGGVNRT